nr:latherin-like [Microcebus murinus]
MLKVSGLLAVLCGLLASSSAQAWARVSPEFINDLTPGLLKTAFFRKLQSKDFEETLVNTLHRAWGDLNSEDTPFSKELSQVKLKVQNPQLLPSSIDTTTGGRNEATLQIPLSVDLAFNFPHLKSFKINVRAETTVQLRVEKKEDGSYRLSFAKCRAPSETKWVRIGSSTSPIIRLLPKHLEEELKDIISYHMAKNLCPELNSWLRTMNPLLINEFINLILKDKSFTFDV